MRGWGVAAALALAAASALVASPGPVDERRRVDLAEIAALAEQGRIHGSPAPPRRPHPTAPGPVATVPAEPYRPVVAFTTWWFSGQHAARYGGLFVDDGNQVVVVHVTGDVGAYEQTVRLVLGPRAPVVVRTVPYSLADLHRGTEALHRAAERLRGPGQAVEVYGPDVESNLVWVLVDPPAGDVLRALREALPGRDAGMLHPATAPPWAA